MTQIDRDRAFVHVTWQGEYYELPHPVAATLSKEEVKQAVTEAFRFGIPGVIPAAEGADFTHFEVDGPRPPTEARPYYLILVRPKTPFGSTMDRQIAGVPLLAYGHTMQISGLVYSGQDKDLALLFPNEEADHIVPVRLTKEEWEVLLRQSDLMEMMVQTKSEDGSLTKALVRKSQRQIDQVVSWTVYRRDQYRCRYCGRNDVPLTVDHLILWEEGGPSTEANLVAACRKCNKTRGSMPYGEWLDSPYYKRVSVNLSKEVQYANRVLVVSIATIPRTLSQRSR